MDDRKWIFDFESISGGSRCIVHRDSHPASFEMILVGWESDESFRTQFARELAAVPFSAFRWETPAVTTSSLASEWEFVLLDSPSLARPVPDRDAFQEHFRHDARIVTFSNLGGDAVLIVPCPRGPDVSYGHFAAFLRSAPQEQIHELWRAVAAAMRKRISAKPVWLSTAGAGVSWLHVRLDDRPKYYGWSKYRS
jgi:hypothetical protein